MQSDSNMLERARALPVVFTSKFDAEQVSDLRHAVRDWVGAHGLAGDATDDLLAAAHELVINAARHGGGHGVLTLRFGAGVLAAEITDQGPGFAGGVPRQLTFPAADTAGGRGLALAGLLSDAMAVTETAEGVTAVVVLRL